MILASSSGASQIWNLHLLGLLMEDQMKILTDVTINFFC